MCRLDNPIRKRIDKAIIDVLSENPYKSKRVSAQEHKGKRIHRVGDYRIIFAICEECRKLGFTVIVRCKDCKKHGSNHVILFSVSHRAIAYKGF
jgi:mRNA-degrading endonuclease RelE of RelBE toxin-antitoxin system